MTDQVDALRAVIDAARRWAKTETVGQLEDASVTLGLAVSALEAILTEKPHGFVLKRMWQEQEPGNWVSPPGSTDWFKITHVVPWTNDDGTVTVTIDLNGKELRADRPATVKVRTKTHTQKTVTESAIETLSKAFPGTEVI